MGRFVRGDVVVLNFPFSDLTGTKRRPALVVADLINDDIILCQITGRSKKDKYAVNLNNGDCVNGNLNIESYVRSNKLFTADEKTILYKICCITDNKMKEVINIIISFINNA